MISNGTPTLLTHLRMTSAAVDLRRQSEAARLEVVTGRKSDLASELGHDTGRAHLLQKAVDDITGFRSSIARLELRSGATQSVINGIKSGVASLNGDLLAAIGRGDETTIANSATIASSELDRVVSQLNTRVEGHAIFAGDGVDGPVLADATVLVNDIATLHAAALTPTQFEADLDFYFNDPAGGFAANFYLGGGGNIAGLEIEKGVVLNGAAKADEQPIKDLLRGLAVTAVVAQQASSPDRDQTLGAAAATLLAASDSIIDIGTRIGLQQQQAANATARLDEEETMLTSAYNAMTSRDPYEAASRLQRLESQIEASYILTSRMSRLSLSNYL